MLFEGEIKLFSTAKSVPDTVLYILHTHLSPSVLTNRQGAGIVFISHNLQLKKLRDTRALGITVKSV